MIGGIDEAYGILSRYPDRCQKIIQKALKKAVAPTVKAIRQNTPIKDARRLVKSKVKKSNDGMFVKFGLFGNKNGAAGQISPWFKAYWMNYGTLSRRDPTHKFEYSIKNIKRKNNTGQRAMRFFDETVEAGVSGMESAFVQAVIDEDKKTSL